MPAIRRFTLPFIASALLVYATAMPLFSIPVLGRATGLRVYCSLLDCVRFADVDVVDDAARTKLDAESSGRALAVIEVTGKAYPDARPCVYGWPEVVGLGAAALAALSISALGLGIWSWTVGATLAGLGVWRWTVIVSVLDTWRIDRPGGLEGNPIDQWMNPQFWWIVGIACAVLGADSLRAVIARRGDSSLPRDSSARA